MPRTADTVTVNMLNEIKTSKDSKSLKCKWMKQSRRHISDVYWSFFSY